MRKALGVAGLLALFVVPMTGLAGATVPPPPEVKVPDCVWVSANAKAKAGVNIGLQAKLLGKDTKSLSETLGGGVAGDVYVEICVAAKDVAVQVAASGMVTVAATTKSGCDKKGDKGLNLTAAARLVADGQIDGSVEVSVKVVVAAGDPKDAKPVFALAEGQIVHAGTEVPETELLADLDLCVGADGSVQTSLLS